MNRGGPEDDPTMDVFPATEKGYVALKYFLAKCAKGGFNYDTFVFPSVRNTSRTSNASVKRFLTYSGTLKDIKQEEDNVV